MLLACTRCSHLEIGHCSCPLVSGIRSSVSVSPEEHAMIGLFWRSFPDTLHIPRFAGYDSGTSTCVSLQRHWKISLCYHVKVDSGS